MLVVVRRRGRWTAGGTARSFMSSRPESATRNDMGHVDCELKQVHFVHKAMPQEEKVNHSVPCMSLGRH